VYNPFVFTGNVNIDAMMDSKTEGGFDPTGADFYRSFCSPRVLGLMGVHGAFGKTGFIGHRRSLNSDSNSNKDIAQQSIEMQRA